MNSAKNSDTGCERFMGHPSPPQTARIPASLVYYTPY
jgi:hypothetical protein